MSIFAVSEVRHRQLQRFRRNTWKAIALCAALRLVDTAFGFGLVEPNQTLAAPSMRACSIEHQASDQTALAKLERSLIG